MTITERGIVHDACGWTGWIVEEDGIPTFLTVDWEPITSGRCPRCNRRLIRRRLRLLNPPRVRGTPASR